MLYGSSLVVKKFWCKLCQQECHKAASWEIGFEFSNEVGQNTHVCLKFCAALLLGVLNFVGMPVFVSL